MKRFSGAGLALLLAACLLAGALPARAAHNEQQEDPFLVTASDVQWTPPDFCRGKQCPEFSVVQTAGDVELRRYKAAHWIMVNITNTTWDDGYQSGFKALQKYVDGENEGKVKMDATNPSLTIFYPAPKGKAFQALYTIEYFVPYELQDEPPVPSADELDILHVPDQEVWVKTFGGFAHESDIVKHAFDFIDQLEKQGHHLDKTWVGFAQYDLPARLIDRHNEVWVFTKMKPSHAQSGSSYKTLFAATKTTKTGAETTGAAQEAKPAGWFDRVLRLLHLRTREQAAPAQQQPAAQ